VESVISAMESLLMTFHCTSSLTLLQAEARKKRVEEASFNDFDRSDAMRLSVSLAAIPLLKGIDASNAWSRWDLSPPRMQNGHRRYVGCFKRLGAMRTLLAVAQFPWPLQGIIACLDPRQEQIARIRDDLRQVAQLLVHDDLGLRPFHRSLFAFVTQLPEHEDYRNPHLHKALLWLQKEAPDYWRWAYIWKVEAALGDDAPLS
jgi:hypothetical protein